MNAGWLTRFSPLLLPMLTLGTACSSNKAPLQTTTELYFPMQSFTAQQAHKLSEKGLSFEKKALLSGDSSQHTVQYDSAGWMKALKAWTSLDLNKPRLQGQYQIDTLIRTLKGAYRRTLRYTIKKEKAYAIQQLVVQVDSLDHVRQISGTLEEDKRLYTSSQKIYARFSTQGILESYTLSGYQKMILSDTVHYRIALQQVP